MNAIVMMALMYYLCLQMEIPSNVLQFVIQIQRLKLPTPVHVMTVLLLWKLMIQIHNGAKNNVNQRIQL